MRRCPQCFQWAQSTGLRVGSWHVAIAQYWIAVQQIARQGYDQYLQTAPLERDIVMVEGAWFEASMLEKTTWGQEQWTRYNDFTAIEGRLLPLLLEALPSQIKKEALSTRCTAVSQLLFATLVASGPGTIRDRNTVLQEVERKNQPTPPLAAC